MNSIREARRMIADAHYLLESAEDAALETRRCTARELEFDAASTRMTKLRAAYNTALALKFIELSKKLLKDLDNLEDVGEWIKNTDSAFLDKDA